MDPIGLKFMIEKREGHGEDSNPLFLIKEDFYAVGVFDGMGGSGATTCVSEYGNDHTKAYVASRIIEEAISNYINNTEPISDINAEGIWNTAKSRLEQEKANFPTKTSGLRSKLVRDYPTTLAIVTCKLNMDGVSTINSFWAGDSRNYLWNSEGFFQISKDDLDVENDPLENLRNDGALSNCICADRDFQINSKSVNVTGPFVIISATDGCFGYFPTPMHFHEVLLTGLQLSKDVSEWENFMKEEMCKVTGDDISLSLCAIGYEDFNTLKLSFADQTVVGFDEIEVLQEDLRELEVSIKEKKTRLEDSIQAGWNNYKISYMKYIDSAIADEESSAGPTCEGKEVKDTSKEELKSLSPDDISSVLEKEVNSEKEVLPVIENKDISREFEEFSDQESLELRDTGKKENHVKDAKTSMDTKESSADSNVEPLASAKEIAREDTPISETTTLSEETEIDKKSIEFEETETEGKRLSPESDIKVDKLDVDNVNLSLNDKSEVKAVIPPKRVGAQLESSTTFPKRVGVAPQKSGLRFGDKEPKMLYTLSKSFKDVSEESINEIQKMLDEFGKHPSKEIAIKLIDAFPILHTDIRDEIKQFLSRL
jgi:hypothetical protein